MGGREPLVGVVVGQFAAVLRVALEVWGSEGPSMPRSRGPFNRAGGVAVGVAARPQW